MSADWFYSDGKDRRGPVTEDDLRQMAADGRLRPDDLVWQNGMPDWVEARGVERLFAKPARPARDPDDAPPRRPRADDEDDRPRSRRRDRDEYDDDRPRRARRRDFEDEADDRRDPDDDRPRVRRRYEDSEYYDREPRADRRMPSDIGSTKIAAGLLAILLGPLGIHKFYLGFHGPGVIYITLTFATVVLACLASCIPVLPLILPFVPAIMAVIEGIIYLTKTDRDFYEIYILRQREWF